MAQFHFNFTIFTSVLLLLTAEALAKSDNATKCGKNAHWTEEAYSSLGCAPNCLKHENLTCIFLRLRPGCDPLPGYAFLNGQSGDCIRSFDCPKNACGKNAHVVEYSFSSNFCAPNCDEPERDWCYMNEQRAGCDPLPGFYFKGSKQSGDAVSLADCGK